VSSDKKKLSKIRLGWNGFKPTKGKRWGIIIDIDFYDAAV
jgi:hypothetical protein